MREKPQTKAIPALGERSNGPQGPVPWVGWPALMTGGTGHPWTSFQRLSTGNG